MKTLHLLPLAALSALSAGFVLPDAQVFEHIAIEPEHRQSPVAVQWDRLASSVDQISDKSKQTFESVTDITKSSLDHALDSAHDLKDDLTTSATDAVSWSHAKADEAWGVIDALKDKKGHHGPPHHGPPKDGRPHCPHHGHEKSHKTVYQLISESKYTTKLAELLNKFPDLVEALNRTEAKYTVFAPTDKAFEKAKHHHHSEPSEEKLKEILSYHVSPHFYPAGRVLHTQTIPTLLKGEHLSSSPRPQRLSINAGLRGLTVNFYSRIVAIDIFGSNGVIHGVDSILVPPPNVIEIIDLLPSEFSTLELALAKTGLLDKFNTTDHAGGTFFAPSNFAFKKLGPGLNAFLFSSHGQKYLKALLEYHVGVGATLYSDAVYVAETESDELLPSLGGVESEYSFLNGKKQPKCHKKQKKIKPMRKLFKGLLKRGGGPETPHHHHKKHKAFHHYELDTMLEGKKVNVDIARYGPFTGIKVNGYSRVVIKDGIASDGVIQVVGSVLIPPKKPTEDGQGAGAGAVALLKSWLGFGGEEHGQGFMCVEEFKARFAGLVDEDL